MRRTIDVDDHFDLTGALLFGVDDLRRSRAGLVFGETADVSLGAVQDTLRDVAVPASDADSHPAPPFRWDSELQ